MVCIHVIRKTITPSHLGEDISTKSQNSDTDNWIVWSSNNLTKRNTKHTVSWHNIDNMHTHFTIPAHHLMAQYRLYKHTFFRVRTIKIILIFGGSSSGELSRRHRDKTAVLPSPNTVIHAVSMKSPTQSLTAVAKNGWTVLTVSKLTGITASPACKMQKTEYANYIFVFHKIMLCDKAVLWFIK